MSKNTIEDQSKSNDLCDENQLNLPLNDIKKRSKTVTVLTLLKDIFCKMALFIFMFFARRLEFAVNGIMTFNPILIGIIWLEWWFYIDGFWQYILPYFTDVFFPTLIKFFEIKILDLITRRE